jgi:hypothetical protein
MVIGEAASKSGERRKTKCIGYRAIDTSTHFILKFQPPRQGARRTNKVYLCIRMLKQTKRSTTNGSAQGSQQI